ncbi:MAG TPA: glutamine-synthetase adenylyltransferase [Bryobacteraceae bacterium]|jgi:glutamate-ammonia-ligase adenylyltransferase
MLPQVDELSRAVPSASPASPESTDPLQLQAFIDHSSDPQRVAQYVNDFRAHHGQILDELAKDSERLHWLTLIFSSSRFLSEELSRHPEWILGMDELHSTLTAAQYKSRLDQFLAERGVVGQPSALDLALFRRKELLRVVLRDRLGAGDLASITKELSNLADAILDRALTSVMLQLGEKHGVPLGPGANRQAATAFTVLALGKLGGHELNYSSDIDLMFLYGENGDTSGPQVITNREFFKKVANQLTSLLSTYTGAGVCYRVDLRLRPEGTLGEVCISLDAAKDYYAGRARDWELQMLIKARVAAGDEALGQELLDFVEPSIYSTSLDFSTIETMSETRERITEKLARKRLRKDDLDVKLARGGIRDIEFLVQCLQRLHGARETWVRHGGTLLALSRLHDRDLLSVTEHSRLSGAYRFLRQLEHILQFEDDRQTHSLPSDATDLERIARRMLPAHNSQDQNISAGAQLLKELNRHLESVQAIYERIVHAQRPLYYTPAQVASTVSEVPQKAVHEDTMIGLLTELLERLATPAPRFTESVRNRSVRRSNDKLASFLDYLLKSPAELHLLESQPVLAAWTLQIFELSPFLAEELASCPELLRELRRAVDHPTRRWAFEGLAAPLNDIGGLRRFFRREMFRILAGGVCLPEPVFQTLDSTSALAEFVIARAYRIALARAFEHAHSHATAEKPFHDPQSEMMVVALGRLGMREFDLGSDADLLFIIPDVEVERQRFWTRVAEHLIDILTAYTGDGTILSLDTRLRPNGREGMLVQTESTYVEYFSSKAEAWEGIAYMKARGVAGDTERATQFLNELQQVDWRRYGQGGRSKHDLRQMRMRLQREQGQITPLKAAEGSYYDADFILMYLRLKGAGMFFKSLNTPERIDIVEKMGHLERGDAEFLQQATKHFRALDHAVRVVRGRSEEKIPAAPDQREMIVELMHRWTGERLTDANLDSRLLELQHKMRQLFDRVFA